MLKQGTNNEAEIAQLIADCRQNNRKAQHRLFKLYYGKVLAICMRYAKSNEEAEDMLNEGFLKLFTNLEKYTTTEKGSFNAWLKRVVVNAIIDYQRKYNTLINTAPLEAIPTMEMEHYDENSALSKLSTDELLGMVQQLPPMARSVFNLYIFENYSHTEIAQLLNIKEGTSHWHLNYARTKLKSMVYENTQNYGK